MSNSRSEFPTPALDLWNQRLASGWQGQRPGLYSSWVYDDLWRAACYEQQALALSGMGCPEGAADALATAQRILKEAD